MGKMTQITVSKHWKKIGPKDETSIPSGPHHRAYNNTTTMQYETKTHKIHINKHKQIYAQWNGPSVINPIQRTVRTTHLSVLMTVHSFSTRHRTVLTISPLTSRQPSQLRCCLSEKEHTVT